MSGASQAVKVGIIGLGNIGSGTVEILLRNAALIERRLGVPLKLVRVADRDASRATKLALPDGVFTTNAEAVLDDPKIQIVVELIGGIEPARSFILAAMAKGKHVVTANKALLATHWEEITRAAAEHRVALGFEASVAGGIPLIGAIRRGLVANRIERVTGIINGTCNYILTSMARERKSFAEVLARAQALGYAEANPSFDVEGIDAAQKLAILVALCFDVTLRPEDITRTGITAVTPLDLSAASELGYRMRLLSSAARASDDAKVEAFVHPALVPISHPLAAVDGVFNAVYVEDDNLGPSLYFGKGAGALPTGGAVVADIVSAARDILSGAVLRMPVKVGTQEPPRDGLRPCGEAHSEFYLRVTAKDEPGVLSAITGVLGKHGISLASVIQREQADAADQTVPVLIFTHETSFAQMSAAISEVDVLAAVKKPTFLARIIAAPASA